MFRCLLACLLLVIAATSFAQNFSIAYKNPDQLVVCSDDTLSVTIQNNTAMPVGAAQLELELPPGLTYLPGSVDGAGELDISNLEKPVLVLPELQPGIPLTIRVQLAAGCGLVEAINSGQLFRALIRVRDDAASEEVLTTNFQIQTSLLVITQVDNAVISGEKGEVLERTIHVRNTRLGPVRHMFLRDTHPAGISIHVVGAATEQDQPTLYTAYFDGAFFSQFGDGDALLEFGETVLIKQEITITDCGIPAFTCRSNILTDWSCTQLDPPCQGDSTIADVQILPSTFQPNLTFTTEYALPWDHCAQRPHEMRFRVINEGSAPATNITLQLNSEAALALGMDKTSFKIRRKGVTEMLTPNQTTDFDMPVCGVTRSGFVTLFIPEMQPQDTADIAFDTYYCLDSCKQLLPKILLNYYYNKPCPPGGFVVADTVKFEATIQDYLSAGITYSIGECLQDGETYPFHYKLSSNRLVSDTGYIWFKFDLPVGLEWSTNCPQTLGGKAPVHFSVTPKFTDFPVNRVLLAYELPLLDTSAFFSFCLRSTCRNDASYVPARTPIPASGDNFFVFVPDDCGDCAYRVGSAALLSLSLDTADVDCGVPSCDYFELQTVCNDGICEVPSAGLPPNPCNDDPACCILREHREAYRLNYDLADNDDDRIPDPGGVLDMTKVRRDRFLPGDTLRNVLSTKVVCGDSISVLLYQLFAEVVGSDIGYAGVNDTFPIGPYQTGAARFGFTDSSLLQLAGVQLTIWDSSANNIYSFPLPTTDSKDRLYGQIALVNTKPTAVIDELATMNYPFNPVMEKLSDAGLLPPGFLLESGDSVQLQVDLKFDMNYSPESKPTKPPLVNFEMGYNSNKIYQFYNYRTFDTLMFQYSGYRDSLTSATFGIRPCETSNQVTPFAYNIRIARENLFPYEVRPMSKISNYDLVLPKGVKALSTELQFLNLQTNLPLQPSQPLPFTATTFFKNTGIDSMLHVDFAPAYAIPPDEGYGLRTRFVFEPSCTFTMPDSSAQWVTLDFPGCMSRPDPITFVLENKLGFFSNHPRDTLTTPEVALDFTTDQVSVNVHLRNKAPVVAPNFWIQLVNPGNGLSNLTITVLGTGAVINPVNGIYQLGSLPILGQKDLQINGINTSCDPQRLLILYGWHCGPYLDPADTACGAPDTLELLFRPRNPEIELELVDFPVNIPLCDTSDYFFLELSNADLGFAYHPFINLELPPGLQLLPGSCQMAYPAGSAFVPIPDPVPAGNNLFEWDIANLQDSIAARGLPGVDTDPDNALQIRFKLIAGCGAVSNVQLVFGARAEWYCGQPTNSLRKASDPILVEGLEPTYGVQVVLSETGGSGLSPCNSEHTMAVSMQVSGPALPGDSIYVFLPPGFNYVSGSYAPGVNSPAGPPQLAGNVLRWLMPAGLPANSIIQFSFKIKTPIEPSCTGAYLQLQTRQQLQAFCPAINGDCTVYVATGEASYYFAPPTSALALSGATMHISSTGTVSYQISVTNNDNTSEHPLNSIQLFFDADHNGQLSFLDLLLYTALNLNQLVPPGGTVQIPLNNLPRPDSICHLLVVLPTAENCICLTAPISVELTTVDYAAQLLCRGDSVVLGFPGTPGHSYSWSGPGNLPCSNCPALDFAPANIGSYQLELLDTGPDCTVLHHYTVDVVEAPILQAGNTTLCRGEMLTLQTSTATSWNWAGPGIVDPAAPTQTLPAIQSAWYMVTATNAAGCSLVDSVYVTVLLPDTVDLGTVRTCEGTPVDIFGMLTDVPGLYSLELMNAANCDSLIYLTLETTPNTEETLARCAPDTVLVFGQAVTVAGLYCETFTSSLGCDSTHCIQVMDYPVPELPDPDTFYIAQGGSVVLPGPDGYASYLWIPADSLSCTTCQSPVASPTDTMEYRLLLRTEDGCFDTVIYRVVPFPPCDPARIRIPNAFTPDGDGHNDVFAVVPYEGSEVISRLVIYNRWGQKVYEASGANAAWDGTTFGNPAPSDVYVWLLEVLCDGERKLRKGDVTVLR